MILLLSIGLIAYLRSEFQAWKSALLCQSSWPSASVNPITYNPVKETITLTGSSKEIVEQVKREIERLLAKYSGPWERQDLLASYSDTESESLTTRSCALDPLITHNPINSDQARDFPVIPKEDPELVKLWFQQIMPKLPEILWPRLGDTYTASLIHRGPIITEAKPCLQIESPRVPMQKAQGIIRNKLLDICTQANQEIIYIRFIQGSIRKLNGEEEEEKDGGATVNADEDLHRFNLVRPFSKPRMGASLGLLCSKTVATLGGYVLVGDKKHMLTSEHFIAQSQNAADIDGDSKTLTSPSQHDLCWIKNSLKQNIRDRESNIDLRAPSCFGNQDIPLEEFYDQEANENMQEIDKINRLLGQASLPPAAYAIGRVFKRSNKPRVFRYPNGLDYGGHSTRYHMDWSLCTLTGQITELENRHKYRSRHDAIADRYIEETEHANQPGNLCSQTCSLDQDTPGDDVYYVGQGSMHREGTAYMPSQVSRGGTVTCEWTIGDAGGKHIPYNRVAGDSGAWVIRKSDDKLMGQVHSYSSGQVHFTPIEIIFDELSQVCGTEISLPPGPPELGPTNEMTPLAFTPSYEPIKPLSCIHRFMEQTSSTTPKKILVESALRKDRPISFSTEDNSRKTSSIELSYALGDIPSSLSGLPGSLHLSVSAPKSHKYPRPFEYLGISTRQCYIKMSQCRTLQNNTGGLLFPEVPCFSSINQTVFQILVCLRARLSMSPDRISAASFRSVQGHLAQYVHRIGMFLLTPLCPQCTN